MWQYSLACEKWHWRSVQSCKNEKGGLNSFPTCQTLCLSHLYKNSCDITTCNNESIGLVLNRVHSFSKFARNTWYQRDLGIYYHVVDMTHILLIL